MLIIPPPQFRKRRREKRTAAANATAALTLVSAAYDGDAYTLMLVFSQAISVAGVSPTQIVVYDGFGNGAYYNAANGTTLINPTTVRFDLNEIDPFTGPDTHLNASSTNGIVAVSDGAAWAGVSGLVLPFP